MRVLIGPIAYQVVETELNGNLCGDIDTMKCRIRIEQSMAPDIKRVTLWHEIVHGILFAAGITDHSEIQVDALAHGLVQLLRDNPELRQC